jgi:hypothetical protein
LIEGSCITARSFLLAHSRRRRSTGQAPAACLKRAGHAAANRVHDPAEAVADCGEARLDGARQRVAQVSQAGKDDAHGRRAAARRGNGSAGRRSKAASVFRLLLCRRRPTRTGRTRLRRDGYANVFGRPKKLASAPLQLAARSTTRRRRARRLSDLVLQIRILGAFC